MPSFFFIAFGALAGAFAMPADWHPLPALFAGIGCYVAGYTARGYMKK